jgi:hypothetical protein
MSLSIDSSVETLRSLVTGIALPNYRQSLTEAVDGRDFNLLFRRAAFKPIGKPILEFLLQRRDIFKIDIDSKGATSGTALEIAVRANNLEARKLLQSQVSAFASSIAALQQKVPTDKFTNDKVFAFTNDNVDTDIVTQYYTTPSLGNLLLGISGFSALEFVKKGIDYILMVDTSKRVMFFWKNMAEIIKNSNNRLECIEKIKENLVLNKEEYQISDEIAEYYKSTERLPAFWLTSNEYFDRVSKIFKKGKFAFLQGDLTNLATCQKIRETFNLLELKTGALYVSNLHDFVSKFTEYGECLKCLLEKGTVLIDTEPLNFQYLPFLRKLFKGPVTIAGINSFKIINQDPEFDWRAVQRIRIIDSLNIKDLYPIIGLANDIPEGEDIFLLFGILMKYFKIEEVEFNNKLLIKELSRLQIAIKDPEKQQQALRQAIANIVYPNEKTSSRGSGGGGGGGGGGSKE